MPNHTKADPHPLTQTFAPGEVFIGTLINIDPDGRPCVTALGSTEPLAALSTLPITRRHLGRQVAVSFVQGQANQPLILGLIHNPLLELLIDPPNAKNPDTHIDGRRVIQSQEEIVLQCGDASLTLRKDGKIIIRGKYLLTESAGVHRLVGGSVLVN